MKSIDSIPVSKMQRASKLVGTGVKIGANYLKYYGEKLIDVNGEDISNWKPMPGVSDLKRIEKQQQLILSLMEKINNFESFNSFLDFVNALENAFTIDQNISIIEATTLLWDFRELDLENVNKLTVPTYNYKTQNGAQVLILDQNFFEFISSQGLVD